MRRVKTMRVWVVFWLLLFGVHTLSAAPSYSPGAAQPDVTITVGNPDGSAIRALLGVNAGPLHTPGMDQNADLTDVYGSYGIKSVRTHDFYGPLDMAVMYPDRTRDPENPASYNFTDSDRYFAEILAAGCEPYFRIGDSWNNVTPPQPSELSNWVKAVVNILQHYRNGKWNGFTSNFTYAEIWNEPDYEQFWPTQYSMLHFFDLFHKTASALRAAFPELKLGGPGFTQNVNMRDSNKEVLKSFLTYIKDKGTPIDFISSHHYTNSPGDIVSTMNSMKQILTEKGFPNLPIHNSEWNNDTTGKSLPEQADLRINAKGAAINAAIWIAFQKCGISESFYFRGNDTNIEMPTFYGLFKADGTPKKFAYVFKLLKYMADYPAGLQVTPSVTSDTLWMVAGKNNAGNKALLISNISSSPVTYGFSSGAKPSLVLEVSDAYEGIHSHQAISEVVEIKGNSVHYVQFDETVINISSFDITAVSPVQPGSTVSIAVGASASSAAPLYYQFYSCGNYGTSGYDSTPWSVAQAYSTGNRATYTFNQAGHYVVVTRVVTDPEREPVMLPIVGATIPVGNSGSILWKRFSSDKTGVIRVDEEVTFTVEAVSSDNRPIYYQFYYCGNYGSSEFGSVPWTLFQPYSTGNRATCRFAQAGNYIVVVRAVTDPLNEPAALPIIGGSFTVQ